MTVSRIGPYPGIVGSVALVCTGVLVEKSEAWGVSGNGLWKLALLELDEKEYAGVCDVALLFKVALELVWKLELAADHESSSKSEVSPGGSLDTWLLLNSEGVEVLEG